MRFMILVKGHKKAALWSLSRNLQKIFTTLTGLKYVCQWVNQKQSFPLQKKLPLKGFFFLTSVKDLETTATDIFTGFKRFLSGVIKTKIDLSIIWGLL